MAVKKRRSSIWLYDGTPQQADLMVSATPSVEGGYVMVMELENGQTRLAATRHPGKYVTSWQQFVRRYGSPEIRRLAISRPHLRYEAIKRGIAKQWLESRNDDLDAYDVPMDTLMASAETIIGISTGCQVEV